MGEFGAYIIIRNDHTLIVDAFAVLVNLVEDVDGREGGVHRVCHADVHGASPGLVDRNDSSEETSHHDHVNVLNPPPRAEEPPELDVVGDPGDDVDPVLEPDIQTISYEELLLGM